MDNIDMRLGRNVIERGPRCLDIDTESRILAQREKKLNEKFARLFVEIKYKGGSVAGLSK